MTAIMGSNGKAADVYDGIAERLERLADRGGGNDRDIAQAQLAALVAIANELAALRAMLTKKQFGGAL